MVDEPNKVQILEQLERIEASEEFAASPRKRKFLRYIVEKTLDGEAASLKGYTIGVDVFERGENFDPQTDTIVRVQARNLRRALNLYYLTSGYKDKLKIEVRKGSYIPQFSFAIAEGVSAAATSSEAIEPMSAPSPTKNKLGHTEWLLMLALFLVVSSLVLIL